MGVPTSLYFLRAERASGRSSATAFFCTLWGGQAERYPLCPPTVCYVLADSMPLMDIFIVCYRSVRLHFHAASLRRIALALSAIFCALLVPCAALWLHNDSDRGHYLFSLLTMMASDAFLDTLAISSVFLLRCNFHGQRVLLSVVCPLAVPA